MKWQSSALLLCVFSLFFSLFYGNIVFAASLTVHNVDTGLSYASIQEAIDAVETLDGHTIFVEAGVYDENIVVDKSLSLIGEDKETTIIDGGGRGTVVRVAADDTVITGFIVRNSSETAHVFERMGVFVCNSSNVLLVDCESYDNFIGVCLLSSHNSIISGNTILNNEHHGICIENSFNTSVLSNDIRVYPALLGICIFNSSGKILENNITAAFIGLYVKSSFDQHIQKNSVMYCATGIELYLTNDSEIRYNDISSNFWDGMRLWNSSSNHIIDNDITGNARGMHFINSSGNIIHRNNFIENTKQMTSINLTNMWDNGYPFGGNYWSDYEGADLYSGAYQNVTGSDGVGDTPYIIDENNTDHYPLIKPYTPIPADLNCDDKVDTRDVATAARAFGSYPRHPRWNSDADINRDRNVDMRDIATVAKSFGKTWRPTPNT